jgi:amphi-Trp domain-containing protein
MTRHIFDLSENATREQAARQLRVLADQIAAGSIELSYSDVDAATPVHEPLHIVVDLTRHRHHFELELNARWPDVDAA